MKITILCLIIAVSVHLSQAKTWKMCELAREMHSHGFPKSQLDDWMCLVNHESRYVQEAINRHNTDESSDWGLFQINDRYWCRDTEGRSHGKNVCNMDCQSFLDGNISDNLKCVHIVYKAHGFRGWEAWKKHCQDELPDTKPCFGSSNKTSSSSKHGSSYDRGQMAQGLNTFWK